MGPPEMDLEETRATLAARERLTSLRQVARELGMSPQGLRQVLDGSKVQQSTRRKLEDWWERYQRSDGRSAREVAVDAVLEFVRSRSRREMVRGFLMEHTKDTPQT